MLSRNVWCALAALFCSVVFVTSGDLPPGERERRRKVEFECLRDRGYVDNNGTPLRRIPTMMRALCGFKSTGELTEDGKFAVNLTIKLVVDDDYYPPAKATIHLQECEKEISSRKRSEIETVRMMNACFGGLSQYGKDKN